MTDNREAQQAGLERADIRQRVLQAVSRLPGRQQRVLLLRELEGLSYAQISQAMGLSLGRVGKILHQARLRFRRAYSSQGTAKETREKCRRLGELLSGHHDDELLGPERRRAVEHLADCSDCRRIRDKLISISELLATLVPTPAPPGLADRVLARTATTGTALAAAGGGTIWKLPLMLLAGGGFIAAVVVLVLFLWQDSDSSSPLTLPAMPTPTATPSPTVTPTPSTPPVLTPAATPLLEETITPTPRPSPSPTMVPSPTPVQTVTPPPTPIPGPSPSPSPTASPTPMPTPTPSPTPSPTPLPLPGGIEGLVTCQDQPVPGAQVTVTGPSPWAGHVWSGVTGGDGTFNTGLILEAGSYIVAIVSPGAGYDSAPLNVPAGSYASVFAQCTTIYRPGH